MTGPGGRWERVKRLYLAAREAPPPEREALLRRAEADDPTVAAEVRRLLLHPSGDSMLDRGLGEVAAAVLDRPSELPPDPAAFAPYRLIRPIGEGGMGVVFLAEREDLGMRVAIKLLRDAWMSPSRRERFLAEQRTLARLAHPGIARIHDAHVLPDGTPWFVMEYVDGVPVTAFAAARGASPADRLRLIRGVAEAVEHAHGHGVIHRDLKPSNILVTDDGSVRLVDFGIAKRLDEAGGDAARTTIPLMTPAYAAPEQWRGEPATARTDIYALGVVLFELLTGRLPFPAETTARGPVGELPPSPSSLAAAGSGGAIRWIDLDAICLRALAPDPGDRYPTVAALITDIDRCLAGEPLASRTDAWVGRGRRWVRRQWRPIAAIGLLALGGAAALAVRGGPRSPTPVLALLPLRNATGDSTLDYLGAAIPEEIANALSSRPGIAVRAFATTGGLGSDSTDLGQVGRRLGVTHLVTGSYRQLDDNVAVAIRLVDVARERGIWEERLTIAPENPVGFRGQVANLALSGMATSLGVATVRDNLRASQPRDGRAYQLYLRSTADRLEPGEGNQRAIRLLEQAVALDSTYAPAWLLLSRRYYIESRYGSGDPTLPARILAAADQAVRHDSNYVLAGARRAILLIEQGRTAEAYRSLQVLLRRRADSPDVHFLLSYVYRFVGMLEESTRECGIALSIDVHNFGWRSCAVASLLSGDYDGAMGFVSLDPAGEWAKAMTMHIRARAGRDSAALAVGRPNLPLWKSYDLLRACLAARPAREVDSLAALVRPLDDPESTFFAATHLARCGKPAAALELLDRAVAGGYCSYPVIDSDPMLASVRAVPAFAGLRERAIECRKRFVDAVAN